MLTEMTLNYQELQCLADALACLRRDEDEMRRMGHRVDDISKLRQRLREALAGYPDEYDPRDSDAMGPMC